MIKIIIIAIWIVLLILAIISGSIMAFDKEPKFPRWLSLNWGVILIIYTILTGLSYFTYLIFF
jgi:hypothetical protein